MADLFLIIIGALSLAIWFLLYIPFIAYHLLRVYNFRSDVTLSKRYPVITVITVICIILWFLSFALDIIRLFFDGPQQFGTIFFALNVMLQV